MQKIIYIIPGLGENCGEVRYKKLTQALVEKGYKVNPINPDWFRPLSKQIFSTEKDSIIFGFSLGAILAWLVAQKHTTKHLILASMTPHYSFKDRKIKKTLIDLIGKKFVDDIIINLKPKNKSKKQTIIYGDLEKEKADILIKNTDHRINKNYISEIVKLLSGDR